VRDIKKPSHMSRTKGGVIHPLVERGIAKLGADISVARRARRISTQDMASRMGVARGTLHRLESGDPGVSINTLAMALSALGMLDRLIDLVDQSTDDVGLMVARGKLPERVSGPRKVASAGGAPLPSRHPASDDDEPEGW